MLHVLQRAVSPTLPLKQTLQNWFEISGALRECARERRMQVEKMAEEGLLLS